MSTQQYYWVDPADTTHIAGPYAAGQAITFPDGSYTGHLQPPAWDANVYEAIPPADPAPDARYYNVSKATIFVGAVNTAAARVHESWVSTLRDIDSIYDAKMNELRNYEEFVLTSNCQTSLTSNWVIDIGFSQSAWFDRVNQFLQDRMRDRVYDADPKDYWPRDVPVVVFNINTDRRLRETVNESQWGVIMKDVGLHSFTATDASELVRSDIDTAYNDGNAQAIVDIDVTDAFYGWPPVYNPPGGAGRARGNGR